MESKINTWVEQQVIHHSDTKYVTVTERVQPSYLSRQSEVLGQFCHGMLCNNVLQGCMQLPMLPPLIVSGVAACMLACEIVDDEQIHMQSLQHSAIFTLIWWGSALLV